MRIYATFIMAIAVTALQLGDRLYAADVPGIMAYQGRLAVNGSAFNGTAQFKFALVNEDGSTTWWSNDGTSTAGAEPTASTQIAVASGLFTTLLGDTNLTNMTAIPTSVFDNQQVFLRIWFNDGTNGFVQLSPDRRLATAGYAMVAQDAKTLQGQTAADFFNAGNLSTGTVPVARLPISSASANGILRPDGTTLSVNGSGVLSALANATIVATAGAVMDSDISATEGLLRKTGSGSYQAIKTNLTATSAPTTSDDATADYGIGSLWIDTTADKAWVCVDASAGTAVWKDLSSSSGGNADTVDGNDASDLLARSNHTGTQTAATISDFSSAADARIAAASVTDLNGISALDTDLSSVSASDDSLASAKAIKTYVDASSVSLTSTQVGFGNGSNAVTGSTNMVFDGSQLTLAAASGTSLDIDSNQASTSSTSGAMTVTGGLGIGADIRIGSNSHSATGDFGDTIGTRIDTTNTSVTGSATLRAALTYSSNSTSAAILGRTTHTFNGGDAIGVHGYGRAENGSDGRAIGIDGKADYTRPGSAGNSSAIGGRFTANTASTTAGKSSYGLTATATATGGSNAATVYGGSFTATGAASSPNAYGIYATATGATANWAGYFDGQTAIAGVGGSNWLTLYDDNSSNWNFHQEGSGEDLIIRRASSEWLKFDTNDDTLEAKRSMAIDGNLTLTTAGNGLIIKQGTNATLGEVTLVGGSATVATSKVTANSKIFITIQSPGGAIGTHYISARSAGTNFTITSTSGTDTSTVAWFIVEPAP